MSDGPTIRYRAPGVTVVWKPQLCMHSRRCWLELPEVFKPKEKPWVKMDGATAERIAAQVAQCPSGALSIEPPDDAEASAKNDAAQQPASTRVEVQPNGPLLVKGTVEVILPDGSVELRELQCALCRCGGSARKPYCDGSHRRIGFQG